MPTIPDDHQPHHDQALSELRQRYPQWVIEGPAALPVYTAELRTHGGRSLHFLAGHDLGELAVRLAVATAPDELAAMRARYPGWSIRPVEYGKGWSAQHGAPPSLYGRTLAELAGKIDHSPSVTPLT